MREGGESHQSDDEGNERPEQEPSDRRGEGASAKVVHGPSRYEVEPAVDDVRQYESDGHRRGRYVRLGRHER